MRIGIGIDTGGTYTDAVAYDFDTQTVLSKGKALTTREDLSVGIAAAQDKLPPEYIREAALVSLSTTLATNACVENKGSRAKLLIFGLTDELIVRFGAEAKYGFKKESVRCIDTHGSADGLIIDEPDWDSAMAELGGWLSDADALAIAELYSMKNGAPCEKHAKTLITEKLGLACVGASELSSDLDVLARGATALLNARLFPIGREFIEAALGDFKRRGCSAPVMVVRSDGSLMSAELTRTRPVETILSGPTASVMAGRSFTEEDDYLIIDMGGTTTDVSAVTRGAPDMASGGIRIGGWRTHVKGVFIDTFALGGDSTVRAEGDKPSLHPRRSMPICVAAARFPDVKPALRELLETKRTNRFPLHEFFYLVREPQETARYNMYEQRLIGALRNGPRILGSLHDEGIDLYYNDTERLESEGIVMRCGLTPTDFMHLRGDYTVYDAEASRLAAEYLLLSLGSENTPDALIALTDEVYELVESRLYENLLRILITRENPGVFENGIDAQTQTLIRSAWAKHDAEPGFLNQSFTTKAALVGMGAPTHVFLPAVAKALGTRCVLPEHAEVANAIGALKADIRAVAKVEISQRVSPDLGLHYIAHLPDGSRVFPDIESAVNEAGKASEAAAIREARMRGALGELNVTTQANRHSAESAWGIGVELGCTVVSEATARFGEFAHERKN